MKLACISMTATCLFAQSALADDHVSTVGSITENNGLPRNGRIVVKTPSILRVTQLSTPQQPDARAAIEQYDRLLELTPEPVIRAEAMRRTADLRLQIADGEDTIDIDEVHKAIGIYRQLLSELPNAANNDRVLYQLARAEQLAGDPARGIEALQTLSTRYPASAHAGDAHFRLAELLYQGGHYEEAANEYQSVIALGPATGFLEPAQYKYGWSLYKKGDYLQALPLFVAILDHELPALAPEDSGTGHAPGTGKTGLADDSLRVVCLSFAALGGGKAINDYFAKAGEPEFSALIYSALGAWLVEKQRYTDAAGVYAAYIERHPGDSRALDYQARMIAAYRHGGFNDMAIRAEENYVNRYAPGGPSAPVQPDPRMMADLREKLDDLSTYYHAKAKQESAATAHDDYAAAARWYRKILDLYPQDPSRAEIHLRYADALYDGGEFRGAAEQYQHAAYDYGRTAAAAGAAYAAVQAWQSLGRSSSPDQRREVLKQSAASGLRLAENFPAHPQRLQVLIQASRDWYEAHEFEAAGAAASRVLHDNPPIELRRQAQAVFADASFAQGHYAASEAAYTQLLAATPASSAEYKAIVDQLTASAYRQALAAREAGHLGDAARHFEHASQIASDPAARASAEFDAASAYFSSQDWARAEALLEGFRSRNPAHELKADVDKKLAYAYQMDGKPALAAAAYQRVSRYTTETGETRREAAWLSATLYDQARQTAQAADAYSSYLKDYPQMPDRGVLARGRLAEFALAGQDRQRYLALQREIISIDAAAGGARSEQSKFAAAKASLELGRADALHSRALALTAPLDKSLPRRKAATENAIAALVHAAGYGYAEITTAATYEIGAVYSDFGRALMNSERPHGLKGDALAQYNLLLEEQANPFEEKAIETHEANLQRMQQGLMNDWVLKSVTALARLSPAKYGNLRTAGVSQ